MARTEGSVGSIMGVEVPGPAAEVVVGTALRAQLPNSPRASSSVTLFIQFMVFQFSLQQVGSAADFMSALPLHSGFFLFTKLE